MNQMLAQSAAVLLGLGVLAGPAAAQTDARKALAYQAIDRNADQIATIGDTVYYFGELGMQEIESTNSSRACSNRSASPSRPAPPG